MPLGRNVSKNISELYADNKKSGKTEYNKPAKTKIARAKYADKAPKINLRKPYSE